MQLPPPGCEVRIPDPFPMPARDPHGGGTDVKIWVHQQLLEDIQASTTQKFFDAQLLIPAFEEPVVIFSGLKRPNYTDGYCYSTLPRRRWGAGGKEIQVQKNRVFVAFVTRMEDGRLYLLDYEWRLQDPQQRGYPIRWQQSFTRQAWP